MTDSQFEMLMGLFKFLGVVSGGVVSIVKFFDWRKSKDKETSVGETAITALKQEDQQIRTEIKKLHEQEAVQDGDIEKLQNHYDTLMNRIWDFLRSK